MSYALDVKENSVDSLNEALAKYNLGESGALREYKFAILHFAHFVELLLKQYLLQVDEYLVFSKCFGAANRRARRDGINILEAHEAMKREGFDFKSLVAGDPNPYTVKVDDALQYAKCERCQVTGGELVSQEFCDDIEWMKALRNNIEHFRFSLSPREVRLAIGRLVRGVNEFSDIFGVLNISQAIDQNKWHTFETLSDEYSQFLREAQRDVAEAKIMAFRGLRLKEYSLIDWNVLDCPECGEKTLIPNIDSPTGYRCTFPSCNNEESEDIDVDCDICGCPWPNGEMVSWKETYDYVCPECDTPGD